MRRNNKHDLLKAFGRNFPEGQARSLLALLLVFAMVSSSAAVEKGWQIELPQRIATTGKQLLTNYSQTRDEVKVPEEKISLIKERLFASEDEGEMSALKKEYLDYRVKTTTAWTKYTINTIDGAGSLLKDLSLYERRLKEATAEGFGEGVSSKDVNVALDIADSLAGMGTIVNMVSQVNPDANVGNLVTSLRTLDQLAGDHFTGRMNPSLESQKELLVGFLVAAKAVKRLLSQEASLLRLKFYTVDAQNIVRVFGELGDVLPNGLGGVVDSINSSRQMDDQVINHGVRSVSAMSGTSMAGPLDLGSWRKELKVN